MANSSPRNRQREVLRIPIDAGGHPRTSQGVMGTPRTPQRCPKDLPGTPRGAPCSRPGTPHPPSLLSHFPFEYSIFHIMGLLGNAKKSQLLSYGTAKTHSFDYWEVVLIV